LANGASDMLTIDEESDYCRVSHRTFEARIDGLSVPEHYSRGASSLRITPEIDKMRSAREVPLTAAAREALDATISDRIRCRPNENSPLGGLPIE
jgi:hypothetical protein